MYRVYKNNKFILISIPRITNKLWQKNCNLVILLGVLLVLTLFHDPIIVAALGGESNPALHICTFLPEFMGIPEEIPPVFKTAVDVLRGASFGVADASILGYPATSMTLNQQVDNFRSMKSNWIDDFIGRSLFMIYIASKFAIQLLARWVAYQYRDKNTRQGNECYEPLNDLVKQHNEKIGPMLNDLAKTNPGRTSQH
ncbi:T10O22.9 [Arabidopsis thaliana]|nr:T10O22.9 [Arabidopsis thaliana]